MIQLQRGGCARIVRVKRGDQQFDRIVLEELYMSESYILEGVVMPIS